MTAQPELSVQPRESEAPKQLGGMDEAKQQKHAESLEKVEKVPVQ